tara:strand:- start:4595 stop:6949 length:2355 start_codon:yes stop_codon:yes gene_type:complete
MTRLIRTSLLPTWVLALTVTLSAPAFAADESAFIRDIEPLLIDYCFDCHGDGADKGGITLDDYASLEEHFTDHELWERVWHNMRSQLMPPSEKSQPTAEESAKLTAWIEREVFKMDSENPDPGRVTLRRLNREEYRHSVKDLLGVDYDVDDNFPPDDTGYGFDTIGDVLTLSPLLMEKYLDAAQKVAKAALPLESGQIPRKYLTGSDFKQASNPKITSNYMPFDKDRTVTAKTWVPHDGRYKVVVDMEVRGSDEATENTATFTMDINGKKANQRDLGWDPGKHVYMGAERDFKKGEAQFTLTVTPKDPPEEGENPLYVKVHKFRLEGPLDGSVKEFSPAYNRIMVNGPPPHWEDGEGRQKYAIVILRNLASRAFRRPVSDEDLGKLVKIALFTDSQPNTSFEEGIRQSIAAILASPSFLFRAEAQPQPNDPGKVVTLDEFALASRLSYFLWSSLPDYELYSLASRGELRKNLKSQVDRMLDDPKSERFSRNFVGQWLQARDVPTINVNPKYVLRLRSNTDAYKVFNRSLRQDMKRETELFFHHILTQNRPATELLTANYTFLNNRLAEFYEIEGVEGSHLRKVDVPKESHRGGILQQATFHVVTSNPSRTSPVKRGLFVLENLLATPAPPAPPDVPELEAVKKQTSGRPTMREMMEIHREKPICAGCHARMDPIGLAFENFNALGMWRDDENGKPIDTAGKLITGETFSTPAELAQVLATERKTDFYRCLAEKMLTYSLGRGVEYYDAPTIDGIAAKLSKGGSLRELIHGVVESAPFQKRRGDG